MPNKIIQWDIDTWNDYVYWQTQDRKTLKRINLLIKDISRSPFEGLGKPEPLKGTLTGFWRRRIDEENRLVYVVEEKVIILISFRGHYED